jgi:hypothetical protein
MTISNTDSLSSVKSGVNRGIRTRKKHLSRYLNQLDVKKPSVVSISQRIEELRVFSV